MIKRIIPVLIFTIFLAACAPATATPPVITQNPGYPPPQLALPILPVGQITPSIPYPAPTIIEQPPNQAYPVPGTPNAATSAFPPSGYEPQPGDAKLERDQVTLDLPNSQVVSKQSQPPQVSVMLMGSLPNPCHQLRVVVSGPTAQNEINLDVYSVFDLNEACIEVIQPFSVAIPMGTLPSGHYTVLVNGQVLGSFDA